MSIRALSAKFFFGHPRMAPILISIILFLGFVTIREILVHQEQKYFHNLVMIRANSVKDELQEKLNETSLALQRLASRTSYLGSQDKKFLSMDAHAYLSHIKMLNRIGLIDNNFKVIWSYPEDKSWQVKGFNQSENIYRKQAIDAAIKNKSLALSHNIELKSGGKGFILPILLTAKNDPAKILYATINANELFQSIANTAFPNYQMAIYEDDQQIFSTKAFSQSTTKMAQTSILKWNSSTWKIVISPSEQFFWDNRSLVPTFVLISGAIISILVGFFLQYVIVSRKRERQLEDERSYDAEWIKVILNSTNHSIISSDETGIIQTFNTAAEKMLGYDKSDIIGKINPEIFHDADEVVQRANALSLELGENIQPGYDVFTFKTKKFNIVDENEWTYIRKDGSRFPVSLSVTALKDLSGHIVGYLGVAIDLTERKKSQEQLKAAHERLERVIEATGEGIWERDYNTKEIKFLDAQAKKIFGFENHDRLTYDQIIENIYANDLPNLAAAVRNHILEKSPRFIVEFRVKSPNPNLPWHWVRARGKVEEIDGVPSRLVSTVSDVTQEIENRLQLEVALIEANAATKVKSAFLTSMSHEIRTPLNGIIGMTDLLLETSLTEDQQRFAHIAQNSGVALLDLINDILDFSKIESGKLELENSDFLLPALVENQTDLLMARARKKNISLMTYISPELPQNFLGDSSRIGQILLNLIGNAVKFTQAGGVIVRVTPATNSEQDYKNYKIRFEVEDSGIGIPESNQAKLFKPFTQADNKISREFGGTGLGLSISKQLVEAMKGEIGVKSALGKGSIFWVEIALVATNPADFFTNHPIIKELKDIKILIIDTDALAVENIHRYISSWKMPDVNVAIPSEAQSMIANEIKNNSPFDLAIIGIQAKADESFRLGQILSQKFGKLAPKLIMLTEFDSTISEEEAITNGFFEILKKPLKQSLLFDSIARSYSNEEKTSPLELNVLDSTIAKKDLRILIADDVKTNRMLAVSMLEKLGYHTHAVSSGKEVLEAFEQMNFDLILMDCFMPEMNGIEATKIIRGLADKKKKRIPIVALTANVTELDKEACLIAGMNAFLSKPLLKKDMEITLEQLLKESHEIKNEVVVVENKKLLLVDDNEENRTLILHYLKSLPYTIEIAVDGQDALNKFKEAQFDIVLMDMQMPVMDGYEATKAIRSWELSVSRAPTVIAALTANALKEESDKALRMGCNTVLTKPIRKQKLVDYLNQLFNLS